MKIWILVLAAAIAVLGGCGHEAHHEPETDEATALKAVADLKPTEGNQTTGSVTFEETPAGIHISAVVEGLEPGKHGFHIHENGDCSAPDATSAGGHYNPENVDHGSPDSEVHHVGDLGNLEADEDGKAEFHATYDFLSLEGENSIVGKAVIVHAGEDDFTTQPTGNAGGRLACGVIALSE